MSESIVIDNSSFNILNKLDSKELYRFFKIIRDQKYKIFICEHLIWESIRGNKHEKIRNRSLLMKQLLFEQKIATTPALFFRQIKHEMRCFSEEKPAYPVIDNTVKSTLKNIFNNSDLLKKFASENNVRKSERQLAVDIRINQPIKDHSKIDLPYKLKDYSGSFDFPYFRLEAIKSINAMGYKDLEANNILEKLQSNPNSFRYFLGYIHTTTYASLKFSEDVKNSKSKQKSQLENTTIDLMYDFISLRSKYLITDDDGALERNKVLYGNGLVHFQAIKLSDFILKYKK